LLVYVDTPKASQVAAETFQVISWRDFQVMYFGRGRDEHHFSSAYLFYDG
jgi:hypothetical protein